MYGGTSYGSYRGVYDAAILSAVEEYAGSRGKAQKNIKLPCPACHSGRRHQRDYSLSVNLVTGQYRCHNVGCEIRGRLMMKPNGNGVYIGPADVGPVGESVQQIRDAKVSFDVGALDSMDIDDETIQWFGSRGITKETLLTWGIKTHYSRSSGAVYRWAAFPTYLHGRPVCVQFRSLLSKSYRFSGDRTDLLYGVQHTYRADGSVWFPPRVVLVEGHVDALSVWQSLKSAGLHNYAVFSVPNGAGNHKWFDSPEWQSIYEAVDSVVVWFDDDEAGRGLTDAFVARFGLAKLYKPNFPRGWKGKDANEMLVQMGEGEVARSVENSIEYPIYGLISIGEIAGDVDRARVEGFARGWSTGWSSLDEIFTLAPGYVTTVTGVPGVGKSTFVGQLMLRLAQEHGVKAAFFSPESRPPEWLVAQWIRGLTGEDFRRLDDGVYREAMRFLDQHFILVNHHRPDVNALFSLFDAAVLRRGVSVCVVDTFSNVLYDVSADYKDVVNDFLNRAVEFSSLRRVAVVVVVHPTKLPVDSDGEFRRVSMYDLYGSAAWANKSDTILSLWRSRKRDDGEVIVSVEKSRIAYLARQGGQARLCYDAERGQYYDA